MGKCCFGAVLKWNAFKFDDGESSDKCGWQMRDHDGEFCPAQMPSVWRDIIRL